MKNSNVTSYNQNGLGIVVSVRRRWSDEVWAGPFGGGRTVVTVINLNDVVRTLTLDFPDVGFQTVGTLKDIWNGVTATNAVTSYTRAVAAHGTLYLELSQTTVLVNTLLAMQ